MLMFLIIVNIVTLYVFIDSIYLLLLNIIRILFFLYFFIIKNESSAVNFRIQ